MNKYDLLGIKKQRRMRVNLSSAFHQSLQSSSIFLVKSAAREEPGCWEHLWLLAGLSENSHSLVGLVKQNKLMHRQTDRQTDRRKEVRGFFSSGNILHRICFMPSVWDSLRLFFTVFISALSINPTIECAASSEWQEIRRALSSIKICPFPFVYLMWFVDYVGIWTHRHSLI